MFVISDSTKLKNWKDHTNGFWKGKPRTKKTKPKCIQIYKRQVTKLTSIPAPITITVMFYQTHFNASFKLKYAALKLLNMFPKCGTVVSIFFNIHKYIPS